MSETFRVVVLGGSGHFGKLIAKGVSAIDGVTVVIAGRNLSKAEACAQPLGAEAAMLDLGDPDFPARLAALHPSLVISAAGPFQGQDYRVARAAIAAGSHYVDIADGREFVCGVTALDSAAQSANVLVIAGASSVPALSAAVVDHLAPRFVHVRSISHGISTSAQIPGAATVAALLGYCGKPFLSWQDGTWHTTYGWAAPTAYEFAAPLGRRWIAPCNVPDLELFPKRYAGVESVQFRAGVESAFMQWGISILASAVRMGVIRDALGVARPLRSIAVAMAPLGGGNSAMFVEVRGSGSDGAPVTWSWELYAENNEGANIPCMAAVAIARKLAKRRIETIGAMPCIGLLTLKEYLLELKDFAVRTVERQF